MLYIPEIQNGGKIAKIRCVLYISLILKKYKTITTKACFEVTKELAMSSRIRAIEQTHCQVLSPLPPLSLRRRHRLRLVT